MSSDLVQLLFPTGQQQYRLTGASAPQVGDILRQGGEDWRVLTVRTDDAGNTFVTLGPCDGQRQGGS